MLCGGTYHGVMVMVFRPLSFVKRMNLAAYISQAGVLLYVSTISKCVALGLLSVIRQVRYLPVFEYF